MEGRETEKPYRLQVEDAGPGGHQIKDSSSSSPSSTPSPPPPPSTVTPAAETRAPVPPETTLSMAPTAELDTAAMAAMGSSENLSRKKRGRPRKYGPEFGGPDSMALALYSPTSPDFSGGRRGRGRPPGSGKRQLLATLGEWFAYSAGGNFTPHVVTVAAGEDVTARILSFSQKGPRSICILSANGAISNVTLRQPGSSGGTLTYEGRFEILTLSGSFTIPENGGSRNRTGGISVSLAGPDGRVVGGGVAGSLLAASPIQVVVGSFMPNTFKEHRRKSNSESSPATQTGPGPSPSVKPVSQLGTPVDDCGTPTSATLAGQSHDGAGNSTSSNQNPNSASLRSPGWQGVQSPPEHKPSPDINISLPGE